MRCSRCDRLAVPQAVGRSPKGLVIFGWCLRCLEETGCRQIVPASKTKRVSTRLDFDHAPTLPDSRPENLIPKPRPLGPRIPVDDRSRLVGAVSLILALWGLAVLGVGLVYRTLVQPREASPLGNGTPALLIGGGGSTAVVGLSLWLITSGLARTRARPALKVIQALSFLVAIGTLIAGIVAHSPRRDPLVVAVASGCLGLSVAARWIETRMVLVRPRV